MENRVYVIGSLNMDVVVYSDILPRPGETVFGKPPLLFPGGKGLNQAVAVQRLGGFAEMVGNLGDDAYGHELYNFLKAEGVGLGGLKQIPGETTGTAYIFVDKHSENFIVVVSGANFGSFDRHSIQFRSGDVVHSQFEIPDTAVLNTFTNAKTAGAYTILNPAPFRKIDKDLIDLTDLLVLNEVELESLIGEKVDQDDQRSLTDNARRALSMGFREIIVTLGRKGTVYLSENENLFVESYSVDAVDTTGAGDTFIGAYAVAKFRGEAPKQAIEFANAAAALSVTKKGASSSVPDRREVEEFIKSR